jgi:hypothetical protein
VTADRPGRPSLSVSQDKSSGVNVHISAPSAASSSPIHSYKLDYDDDPVVAEVQTINTQVMVGQHEIQMISTKLDGALNERQMIQTFANYVPEVQSIKVKNAVDGGANSQTGSSFFLKLDTTSSGGSLQFSGNIRPNATTSGEVDSVQEIIQAMQNVHPGVKVSRELSDNADEVDFRVTFPDSMRNVPELTVDISQLEPSGTASVSVTTITEGNLISGTFKLSWGDYTTEALPHDATAAKMRAALESFDSVGILEVVRTIQSPPHQDGYIWFVDFVSRRNDGDLSSIIPLQDGLHGDGVGLTVTPVINGSLITGSFNVSIDGWTSQSLPYNVEAHALKSALEQSPSVTPGSISVLRHGPDRLNCFNWTVEFLAGHSGDLNPMKALSEFTHGSVEVVEVRKGSTKEVQKLTTTSLQGFMNESVEATLTFRGMTSIPFPVLPSNDSCSSSVTEVQTITSMTADTVQEMGVDDSKISPNLQFRLSYSTIKYGDEVTDWISANPRGSGDCSQVASNIQMELEKFDEFLNVAVSGSSTGVSQGCIWTVSFIGSIGNLEQLEIQSRSLSSSSFASEVGSTNTVGYDTLTVATIQEGKKEALKAALQLLPQVGEVSVSSQFLANGNCEYLVTFDTLAGSNIELMQVALRVGASKGETPATTFVLSDHARAEVSRVVQGTSAALGGFFSLSFGKEETYFLPHDATARAVEQALEGLKPILEVSVSRSPADENDGYSWSVTFLTNTPPLPNLVFNGKSLTGSVATGLVYKAVAGIAPSFASAKSELVNPDVSVVHLSNLATGRRYYFRLAAINADGESEFAIPHPPFIVPEVNAPDAVFSSVTVNGGSSLEVEIDADDIGQMGIDAYKIEYGKKEFVDELQRIKLTCDVMPETQVISTVASKSPEIQLVHIHSSYLNNGSSNAIQNVRCDASGGVFKLSFMGEMSEDISYNASAVEVATVLKKLRGINDLSVSFDGQGSACSHLSRSAKGFNVEFLDVQSMTGKIPLLSYFSNSLEGLRRISVASLADGDAPPSGTFRLSYEGASTADISVGASFTAMKDALEALDTIPTNCLTVNKEVGPAFEVWSIQFDCLAGDVPSLQEVSGFNRLLGSEVELRMHVKGSEDPIARDSTTVPSRTGSVLGGSFSLGFRGYTTPHIQSDVSESVMKTLLEAAFPNVVAFGVHRSGPSHRREFSWTVTFLDNSGTFPRGSFFTTPTSTATLEVKDSASLIGGSVGVTRLSTGSNTVHGNFTVTYGKGGSFATTSPLTHDVSGSELANALNTLSNLGTVSVVKEIDQGFGNSWYITFDGCKKVNGIDKCSTYDVDLLSVTMDSNLATSCNMHVSEVKAGSTPMSSVVVDATGSANVKHVIRDLHSGIRYFVRTAARNNLGFGIHSATSPVSVLPHHSAPSAPPKVRMLSSSRDSITVGWDAPRHNGGAPVMGYQLFAGPVREDGKFSKDKLVFDGTAQPDVMSFTVKSLTSFAIENMKKYGFVVRSMNYCSATAHSLGQTRKAC